MISKNWQKKIMDFLIPAVVVVLTSAFFGLNQKIVQSRSEGFPKLANYFLKTPITDAEAVQLAKWDLIILGMQAQDTSPEQIKKIRQLNPQIKILAYVASQEFPVTRYQEIESVNGPWHKLWSGIQNDWWLNRPSGEHFSSWPGNWSLNVTNEATAVNGARWNTYLPQFMHDVVMSTGLWDGIFYDNVWGGVSGVANGQIDSNRDGVVDDAVWLDQKWREGMEVMLGTSRQLEGVGKIILGNGGNEYKKYLNGRLVENAYYDEPWTNWVRDQQAYQDMMAGSVAPHASIINNNTHNTGQDKNYQLVRYGLASALLDNGYYSFDYGTNSHGELWWYDEYDVNLGAPTSTSYNLTKNSAELDYGLWRRDFTRGVVFVNSTTQTQTLSLGDEELEKITGRQDATTNDGSRVNYVRLSAHDGVVMLRPLTEVLGGTFVNGYFARIFNGAGQRLQGGFYTYKKQYAGSSKINVIDVDADGDLETVVAGDSKITIYSSNGVKEAEFFPYGEKYRQGINFAVGDLNGDGRQEILTGTKRGGGPQVRIFNSAGKLINPGFFAYASNYRGGVNVALCDLNGDGIKEIVAGAGVGGGPQIRIFNSAGKVLSGGWFAYDAKFRGGVNVACGDLNNDGNEEIVSAPGFGGSPEIKVWDSHAKQIGASFMAFDPKNRAGVFVVVNDVNNDGRPEILATANQVF